MRPIKKHLHSIDRKPIKLRRDYFNQAPDPDSVCKCLRAIKTALLCESQCENSKEEVYHSFDFIMLLSFEHVDIQHKCQRHRFATHYINNIDWEIIFRFYSFSSISSTTTTQSISTRPVARGKSALFHYRKIGCFEGRIGVSFLRIGTNKRQSNLQSASHN